MKHLRALLSTLVLSSALLVSGVTAMAATGPADVAVEQSAPTSTLPTVAAHGFYWELTTAQDVLAGNLLVARRGSHSGSHGTRSDRQFFEISSTGSNDVPAAALRAYRHAEKVMAVADPGCGISWTLLAAIGRVESNHGRFGGAEIGSDGISRPEIRGPQLNGAGAFAAISDTDHGTLDHDVVWDRAVGQMQFLPETWRSVARDGDGDGRMNPDDIDDSALGSAVYLCGAGGSLADPAGAARAAFRYNHSDYYVQLVLSFASGYSTGVFVQPTPPPPAPARTTTAHPRVTHSTRAPKPHATRPATASATPRPPAAKPSPTPKPSPQPAPKPKPTPTPAAPALVAVDGTWNACGAGFCLGSTSLDLGSAGLRGSVASTDFDGDGATESNQDEFTGLVGRHVSLKVERHQDEFVVYLLEGAGFRNADGSFARTVAPAAASDTTS